MTDLPRLLRERVLVLDGAIGTVASCDPCVDFLCLWDPARVRAIHARYLAAGADIIETNTFNANAISLADWGHPLLAPQLNLAAAKLAREVADSFSSALKPRFVAGSIGPTSVSLSRALSFDAVSAAYAEQIASLVAGGVDILLIETVVDSLNAKAAVAAAAAVLRGLRKSIPIAVAATVCRDRPALLTGQSLAAFVCALPRSVFAVGLNCSYGAAAMTPVIRQLSAETHLPVFAYPSAGLPDAHGSYGESAEAMATVMAEWVAERLVNVIGGCCGTTDDFTRLLVGLAATAAPRVPRPPSGQLALSGFEKMEPSGYIGCCHAAAIASDETALEVCIDSEPEMLHSTLRNLCLARVPLVVNSSDFTALIAGLKCLPGKGIARGLSLVIGEKQFVERGIAIRDLGAAVAVLDWENTFEQAVSILTETVGFPECDVVLDVYDAKPREARISQIKARFPAIQILLREGT